MCASSLKLLPCAGVLRRWRVFPHWGSCPVLVYCVCDVCFLTEVTALCWCIASVIWVSSLRWLPCAGVLRLWCVFPHWGDCPVLVYCVCDVFPHWGSCPVLVYCLCDVCFLTEVPALCWCIASVMCVSSLRFLPCIKGWIESNGQ